MKKKTRIARDLEQQRIERLMNKRLLEATARSIARTTAEMKAAQDAAPPIQDEVPTQPQDVTEAQDVPTEINDVVPEEAQAALVDKVCVECGATFSISPTGQQLLRKLCPTCKTDPAVIRKRATASKQRERQRTATASATSKAAFWQSQRALLTPEKLAELEDRDAYVRTLMRYVRYKQEHPEIPQDVLDHVFAKLDEDSTDVEAEVRDFVKANPGPHLGFVMRDLSIPNDWGHTEYWKDAALLAKLIAEGPTTEVYVLYGLLAGIPDWIVPSGEEQVVDNDTRYIRYK